MPQPWALGAQARINGTLHGQQTVNVLHFASNTAELDVQPPSPLLTALVAAVLDCVITALLPAVTQDWTVRDVTADFIYTAGGTPLFNEPVIATAPANSIGELGPTSVSFAATLVNYRSGLSGRNGRGRSFLPPPGEANVTASAIDPGTMTQITAFLTCMAGKFLGTGATTQWRMGILSRKILAQTVGGGFDNAFREATQLSPVANLAVISRRKAGHGR